MRCGSPSHAQSCSPGGSRRLIGSKSSLRAGSRGEKDGDRPPGKRRRVTVTSVNLNPDEWSHDGGIYALKPAHASPSHKFGTARWMTDLLW